MRIEACRRQCILPPSIEADQQEGCPSTGDSQVLRLQCTVYDFVFSLVFSPSIVAPEPGRPPGDRHTEASRPYMGIAA